MATRAQAIARLAQLDMELDPSVSGRFGDCWSATIDAVGRNGFNGDCCGIPVHDYTATASEFWQMVIDEAERSAAWITPCPHPPGECEFHDEDAV